MMQDVQEFLERMKQVNRFDDEDLEFIQANSYSVEDALLLTGLVNMSILESIDQRLRGIVLKMQEKEDQ
jgi:hypothetical protein